MELLAIDADVWEKRRGAMEELSIIDRRKRKIRIFYSGLSLYIRRVIDGIFIWKYLAHKPRVFDHLVGLFFRQVYV